MQQSQHTVQRDRAKSVGQEEIMMRAVTRPPLMSGKRLRIGGRFD